MLKEFTYKQKILGRNIDFRDLDSKWPKKTRASMRDNITLANNTKRLLKSSSSTSGYAIQCFQNINDFWTHPTSLNS